MFVEGVVRDLTVFLCRVSSLKRRLNECRGGEERQGCWRTTMLFEGIVRNALNYGM